MITRAFSAPYLVFTCWTLAGTSPGVRIRPCLPRTDHGAAWAPSWSPQVSSSPGGGVRRGRARLRRLVHVVIAEVYGGGGNSGAPYTNDYIELINNGSVAGRPDRLDGAVRVRRRHLLAGHPAVRQHRAGRGDYLVEEAAGAGGTAAAAHAGRVRLDRDVRHHRQGRAGHGRDRAVLRRDAATRAAGVRRLRRLRHARTTSRPPPRRACPTPPRPRARPRQPTPTTTPPTSPPGTRAEERCRRRAGRPRTRSTSAIHDIQGAAHRSPLVGERVADVHRCRHRESANGFWFQDPQPDDDIATSEGLFVFTSSAPTVAVGDA